MEKHGHKASKAGKKLVVQAQAGQDCKSSRPEIDPRLHEFGMMKAAAGVTCKGHGFREGTAIQCNEQPETKSREEPYPQRMLKIMKWVMARDQQSRDEHSAEREEARRTRRKGDPNEVLYQIQEDERLGWECSEIADWVKEQLDAYRSAQNGMAWIEDVVQQVFIWARTCDGTQGCSSKAGGRGSGWGTSLELTKSWLCTPIWPPAQGLRQCALTQIFQHALAKKLNFEDREHMGVCLCYEALGAESHDLKLIDYVEDQCAAWNISSHVWAEVSLNCNLRSPSSTKVLHDVLFQEEIGRLDTLDKVFQRHSLITSWRQLKTVIGEWHRQRPMYSDLSEIVPEPQGVIVID